MPRDRDTDAALSKRIARLRLTIFLVGAAGVVWMISRGVTPVPLALCLLLFAVFGGLVVWHARVDARVAWFDALRLVNLRAMSRRARDWHALPDAAAPATVDLADHPYAVDLDLFGHASLFQWLGPAATPRGRTTLADWLLRPASRAEIVERQAATSALAAEDDWRLRLEAHGVLAAGARQAEIDHFLMWAEGPDAFGRHAGLLRVVVFTLVAALWILIALHATGMMSVALWPIPLVAGIILSFATAERLQSAFDRAGGGQDALARYAAIFEHASDRTAYGAEAGRAPRPSVGRWPARRPRRCAGSTASWASANCAAARRCCTFRCRPSRCGISTSSSHSNAGGVSSGRRVRGWLEALGELEALTLLATARRDNPGWAAPEFGSAREVAADDIGHPLIPDARRVANSVKVGPPGSVLLITGSNMSGKSTLLRSIGLNIVLAHAGSCVCARHMSLPDCDLQTSIRVTDSLERGLSYFMAALARLKGVVDAAQHERKDRVLVYLLDEILQGTNSVERSLAVRAVTRHLLDAGAIGAMTTHDLGLADEEPLKSAAQLMHFSETLDADGTMGFDYVLKPGIATSRNALRLMQMIGIDL